MSKLGRAAEAAVIVGSLLLAPALAAKPRQTGAEQLADLLRGRSAGKPQRCISTFADNNLKIISGTAIVYDDGRTIWVNRTRNPASLDDDDILVIRRTGSDLCRLDNVRAVSRGTGALRAIVMLGDFVPYERPAHR